MSSLHLASVEYVVHKPARTQFDVFLDEHRTALNACLNGLTEEQARRSLVPSRTTLLGLVKHATFVEKVWFDEAITCRPRGHADILREQILKP
jgi:spore germination protein GerM